MIQEEPKKETANAPTLAEQERSTAAGSTQPLHNTVRVKLEPWLETARPALLEDPLKAETSYKLQPREDVIISCRLFFPARWEMCWK